MMHKIRTCDVQFSFFLLRRGGMPKSTKIKLTYHVKAGQETEKAHKHVSYSIGQQGNVSTARSTIRTNEKAESSKKEHTTDIQNTTERGVHDWNTELDTNKEAVDQAYLEHIAETALDEKDKEARVRPKGVSY